jgi:ubiquinone/menaquinone biosynthesis C-methylase UbiE
MTGVERMMDLGGGSGVVSMALLQKYPALTSTVVDLENVCIAGREIAQEQGFSDRISFYAAEFSDGEFPAGYELALQCDVGAFGVELFRKVRRAVKPGGRLVLVEHFAPAEGFAPPTRLTWTLVDSLRDPNFAYPTFDQVSAQLLQAGFQVSPERKTVGKGWGILQARKTG